MEIKPQEDFVEFMTGFLSLMGDCTIRISHIGQGVIIEKIGNGFTVKYIKTKEYPTRN